MIEEGKGARRSDIKLANPHQEEKRVKARKKLKSLRSQLTSEARMWTRVLEMYAKFDNLFKSQKAHLKSTCDLQTDSITNLQTGIDNDLKCLLEIAAESEVTDTASQKALDD